MKKGTYPFWWLDLALDSCMTVLMVRETSIRQYTFFTLIFTAIMIVSCNRQYRVHDRDQQIEWGYQLIDQHEYDQAISTFNQLLSDQDSPTVRLGLATAYAARAGVRVESYWDLVVPGFESKPPTLLETTKAFQKQWTEKIESLPNDLRIKVQAKSDDVFRAEEQIEILKWRFQKIPLLTNESQNTDLVSARQVLQELPNKGIRIYRALLGLIMLKYELQKLSHILEPLFQGGLQSSITEEQWPCPDAVKNWFTELPVPLELTSDVLIDVKFAYPKKAATLNNFETQFNLAKQKVNESTQSARNQLCGN